MVCSICLEVLRKPFVTPCGHVFCLECLVSSSRKSSDGMKAPCPVCRATFSLVSPEPAFIPEKYRPFIDSNIRRIYLDDSQEIALGKKVAQLESRVKSLEKDKHLLITRCEAHMAAATSHAHREKDARLKCDGLELEVNRLNLCVAELVEKEAKKKSNSAIAAQTCSYPSSHAESSLGYIGMPNKRAISAEIAQMNFTFQRPVAPLPKRRRVVRQL